MISTSFALFAAIATAKPAIAEHTVAWKPKVNETTKLNMKFTMQMDAGGQMMEIIAMFNISSKTTKIDGDKVTEEGSMSDFKLLMNGQEMGDMGGGAPPEGEKTTIVRKLNGEVISDSTPAEMGGGERMQRFNAFYFPEKPVIFGDSWTHEWAADKAKGLQSAKAKYTLEGEEVKNKVDCWKISVVFAELDSSSGMSNMGTVWLEKANGNLVYSKMNFQNVSFQEGMPPTNGVAEITRIK